MSKLWKSIAAASVSAAAIAGAGCGGVEEIPAGQQVAPSHTEEEIKANMQQSMRNMPPEYQKMYQQQQKK